MTAFLDDPALIHHQDPVGFLDGRKPVRHHEGRTALHKDVEGLLHQRFAFRVEGRRRFVQQQDRSVLQQRARYGDALALTARQRDPAFSDQRVISVFHAGNERVRQSGLCRVPDLRLRCVGTSKRNIVPDGACEDRHILRHAGKAVADGCGIGLFDVDIVQKDRAAGRVVKAADQPEKCALACPGRADDRDRFARRDGK